MMEWLKRTFSNEGEPSSKRQLAAYFSIILTIVIFTQDNIELVWSLMTFIATLLGLTIKKPK